MSISRNVRETLGAAKMTAKTFTNTAGGTWETGSNWTPAGQPTSTDDAFINQAGTYTVTLDAPGIVVNTVTLNDPNATLSITGTGVLIPNSTVALEAGTFGLASGGQVISATIVNTGATLAMTGGTLDGVTWHGRLGQDAGFGSVVIKDGIALADAAGNLPGTLEISGLFSVSIADANTLDHMTIDFGNFNIEHLNGSSSFALILGSAATINQTAPSASGQISGVELDNHGLINLDSSGGNFFVGSGTFDNFGSMVVAGSDAVTVNGTFSNTGSVAVSASGSLSLGSNAGTNSGSIDITSAGTFTAPANIGGAGVISLSVLGVADVHNVSGTVLFLDGKGILRLEAPGSFTGSTEGFQKGDKINLPGQTVTTLNPIITPTATTLEVLNGSTTIASLNLLGNYTGFVFNHGTDGAGGTNLTVACYAAGTRLLTARGEVAVEALREKDSLVTLSGHGARLKPVRWIGRSRVDLDRHPRPESAAPIRIRAGAFAADTPHSDLLLSPDHGVLVTGTPDVLVPARYLVNGITVVHEPACGTVDYFHIELDQHGIVVAEGLAVESYLDTGNRAAFASAGALEPNVERTGDREARVMG
jgi:hypothetical protein